MLHFTISRQAAGMIQTLFPCTNRSNNPNCFGSSSTGSRERNKVIERFYDLDEQPRNVTLTIQFPAKDQPSRPQVWKIARMDEYAENRTLVELEEQEAQFVLRFSGHTGPFFFPKQPMTEKTIARIRSSWKLNPVTAEQH